MPRTLNFLIAPTVLLAVLVCEAVGEVFVLEGGGQLEGQWVNPDAGPRDGYLIEIAPGSRVTLDRSQVKKVLYPRAELVQYEALRPRFPDTVEGQWALAEWCREQGLNAERRRHLERIIEIDGDHVQARQALGYGQVDGQWMTQEEKMNRDGYIRYQGRWRLPQEVELMEGQRKIDGVQREWSQKINRWRKWLETDRAAEGRSSILAIKDPLAVKALSENLKVDPLIPARLIYIEALARIGSSGALMALATGSIEDPIEEVRLTCLDRLQEKHTPEVTRFLVGKLRAKDNPTINRAAVSLGRLGDATAVGPLVDSLVTTHQYVLPKAGGPGSMTTTFGTGPGGSGAPGGGGLAMGGGPQVIQRHLPNQAVLDALVALTGYNFGYDQRAWKYWYASQKKSESVSLDARRD